MAAVGALVAVAANPEEWQQGTYAGRQWAALVLIIVVVVLWLGVRAWWIGRQPAQPLKSAARRGRIFMGEDGRLSTSKTIALAWTFIVLYVLAADGLVAAAQSNPGDAWNVIFAHPSPQYLLLLGGPFAAAVLAKVAVIANLDSHRQQKTPGDGKLHPFDLIGNDSGATDLYDFQYVVFNVIAMVSVLAIFIHSPSLGPPNIPDFVAILTGGAAATYTINKAASSNSVSIAQVIPGKARVGDWVGLYGQYLWAPSAAPASGGPAPETKVTVGKLDVPAADIKASRSDLVQFRVPSGASPGAQDVTLTTVANAVATELQGLEVIADKIADLRSSKSRVQLDERLTLYGFGFFDPQNLNMDGHAAGADDPQTIAKTWPAVKVKDQASSASVTLGPEDFRTPSDDGNTQLCIAIPSKDTNGNPTALASALATSASGLDCSVVVSRGALSESTAVHVLP